MSKCSEDISKSPLNHISRENKDIDPSHYLRQIRSVSMYHDVMTSLVASKIQIFMKTGMIFGIRPKKKSYNAMHHFLKGNTSTLTPYHYFGQNMDIVTS